MNRGAQHRPRSCTTLLFYPTDLDIQLESANITDNIAKNTPATYSWKVTNKPLHIAKRTASTEAMLCLVLLQDGLGILQVLFCEPLVLRSIIPLVSHEVLPASSTAPVPLDALHCPLLFTIPQDGQGWSSRRSSSHVWAQQRDVEDGVYLLIPSLQLQLVGRGAYAAHNSKGAHKARLELADVVQCKMFG